MNTDDQQEQPTFDEVQTAILNKIKELESSNDVVSNNPNSQSTANSSDNQKAATKKHRDLVPELSQIQKSKDTDFKEKAELLNKFFHDAIIVELRKEQKRTIDIIVNGQMMGFEANEYEQRYAKSDTIRQRYELLSREYNT